MGREGRGYIMLYNKRFHAWFWYLCYVLCIIFGYIEEKSKVSAPRASKLVANVAPVGCILNHYGVISPTLGRARVSLRAGESGIESEVSWYLSMNTANFTSHD